MSKKLFRKFLFVYCLATASFWSFAQPIITNLSPTSAKPGDTLTITGTSFNTTISSNIVFFGATRASITSASATSLIVIVPIGAIYGPVTVLNTGTNLAAFSSLNFNPIYSLAKTGITTSDFMPRVNFRMKNLPVDVSIGDLDGDGKADLVIANQQSGEVISIFRNTTTSQSISTTSLSSRIDISVNGGEIRTIALGDVDGDGKLDIVAADFNLNTVIVFRNTSSGVGNIGFASKVSFSVGTNPFFVAIGDLDGDGKPDLVSGNANSANVSVLRNTSSSGSIDTNSFAAKVNFTTGTNPRSVVIGDLNGDGKPDLATANGSSHNLSVLINNSSSGSITSGSFASKVDFSTGNDPTFIVLVDLDLDGQSDLVTTNNTAGNISVMRNTTTTSISFATSVNFSTGTTPRAIGVGDLDGDGKPDLAVVNQGSATISLFRNIASSGSFSSSSFAAKVDIPTSAFPKAVAIGDLDSDGKPDISYVFGNANFDSISILRNTDYLKFTTNQTVDDIFLRGTMVVDDGVTLTVSDTFSFSYGSMTLGNSNLIIGGTLDVSGGLTLASDGKITLASGARIANLSDNSGGSISGNITVERLIPGSRKFRLLGHPFNTAQNLSILTDDIDITGNTTGVTDGNAKTLGAGFTATTASVVVNNPSAFWFNTANANGQSNDGGWSAFTSADGSGANNTWGVGEGIRVLIRGAKGQGLDGNAYTPSDVTFDMTGTVNTGNVNVDLVTGGTGSASGFNLIGNPYASPIDISAVVFASAGQANINKTIYTRNPQTGSYTSQLLSNGVAYNIPSYTGILVRNTGASTVTLPFTEARKAGSSALVTMKNGITHTTGFECKIGGVVYDNFNIGFDPNTSALFEDKYDGIKLGNDSFNMSVISSNGEYLSTDFRPYIKDGKTKLFTNIKSGSTQIEITAANFGLSAEETLYFTDELSKTSILVTEDFKYTFTIDAANTQTFGSDRFYFTTGKTTAVNELSQTQFCNLFPNPAKDVIQLSVNTKNEGEYAFYILNQLGQTLMDGVCELSNGKVSAINIAELNQGIYFLQISNGGQQQTIKFIK